MRLNSLELINFRCFKRVEILFDRSLNVILGVNGSGKTSLIEAMSIALYPILSPFELAKKKHIASSDVHVPLDQRSLAADGRVYRSERQFPCTVLAEFSKGADFDDGKVFTSKRSLMQEGGRTTTADALAANAFGAELLARMKGRRRPLPVFPVIAMYGSNRLWAEPRTTNRQKTAERSKTSRAAAYFYSIDPRISKASIADWLLRLMLSEDKISLSIVEDILSHFLDQKSIKLVSLETVDDDICIRLHNGDIQPMSFFSDGQKIAFWTLLDIIRQGMRLNPEIWTSDSRKQTGIVIIDEIDLHLHAQWQRRILDTMRSHFPKVQLILTTHSPLIVGSVSTENLLILNQSEVIQGSDYNPIGIDANYILRDIFKAESRLPEVSASLKAVAAAINGNRFEDADKKLDQLEGQFRHLPEISGLRAKNALFRGRYEKTRKG
ncbi:MAG: AAA family ATPase [Alphaproteobacteria bacterium]|nr:AAA family ATPase [Alphaproteobacteria bacterium]